MYDINALETQWRKYKRRKYISVGLGSALILLAATGALYYLSFGAQDTGKDNFKTASNTQTAMNKNEDKSLSAEVPSVSALKTKKGTMRITFGSSGAQDTKEETYTPTKHVDIKVTSKNSKVTVQEMEARFKNTHDKDDALFLARYYYDAKKYSKALQWALETNKLDSEIEESWILFGKSKAKLGSRKEAIRVLQAYIERSESRKAKILLDKIRRGKDF